MKLFIPTAGRVARQTTAEVLRAAGVDFTLVVRPGEGSDLARKYPVVVCECDRINTKRDAIMRMGDGKLVMLDDDLHFYKRGDDGRTSLATPKEVVTMLDELERALDAFAHGGIAERAFAHVHPTGVVVNRRYIRVLAYNLARLPRPLPKFRTITASDIDMALQLMKAGLPSVILSGWAQQDRAFNDKGGCSMWRTREVLMEGHRQLVQLHPDVVEIRPTEKDPAHLRINWRRAAEIGGCAFKRGEMR